MSSPDVETGVQNAQYKHLGVKLNDRLSNDFKYRHTPIIGLHTRTGALLAPWCAITVLFVCGGFVGTHPHLPCDFNNFLVHLCR